MKNKLIGAAIIISVAIITILVVFLLDKNNEIVTPKKLNKDFTYIGTDYDEHSEITIFKTYEDLAKKFPSNKINQNSFDEYNYLLISIKYDSCGEINIKPVDYTIKNGVVNIVVQYENTCGGPCPLSYYNYVLKIKKDTTITNIDYEYQNVSKKKCHDDPYVTKKPIIYLYPTEETNVVVKLSNPEKLTTTYPKYKDSWNVTARPDGTLIDNTTNRTLYGLYWEGIDNGAKQTNEGFIVKGTDTIKFLEEKLSILGLNEKEAEEFIIYWLPILEKNNYNYIRFSTKEEIENYMKLDVTPQPDTTIRIIMNYKPLDKKINVKEQELIKQERNGFTLVEWGGSRIKD